MRIQKGHCCTGLVKTAGGVARFFECARAVQSFKRHCLVVSKEKLSLWPFSALKGKISLPCCMNFWTRAKQHSTRASGPIDQRAPCHDRDRQKTIQRPWVLRDGYIHPVFLSALHTSLFIAQPCLETNYEFSHNCA